MINVYIFLLFKTNYKWVPTAMGPLPYSVKERKIEALKVVRSRKLDLRKK